MTQDESLARVKQIELSLLRDFIELCNALNLQYFALGGTLLGAVRHAGFIPWDDDIDVGMPRGDYERLLTEAPALLPENDFLQTWRTDPEFPANFAKLRRSGTAFVERSLKNRKIHHGIYIDIFPLDYCPAPGRARKRLLLYSNLLLQRLSCRFYHPQKSIKMRLRQIAACLLFPSCSAAVSRRERLLSRNPESDWVANYCGAWGEREIVPASWYGQGQELSFEGLRLRVPSDYRAWLSQVYGDYTRLPPEAERHGHHTTEYIDPDHAWPEPPGNARDPDNRKRSH